MWSICHPPTVDFIINQDPIFFKRKKKDSVHWAEVKLTARKPIVTDFCRLQVSREIHTASKGIIDAEIASKKVIFLPDGTLTLWTRNQNGIQKS